MDKRKLALASLLAEVKVAEKRLEKAKAKLPAGEARIKQALISGNREAAKKYALDYEEQKLVVGRCEQAVQLAKRQYEQGKMSAANAPSGKALRRQVELTGAMNKLADTLDMVNRDEDMVQKIEEDAAHADARLDIALDDARMKNPELDLEPGAGAGTGTPIPPASTAEDILKEFE